MNAFLVAPLALVALGALAGWFLPKVAGPATCAWVLTLAAVIGATGLTAALLSLSLAAVSETGDLPSALGWCHHFSAGLGRAMSWVGAGAALVLLFATAKTMRFLRHLRRDLSAFAHVDGVEIVTADGPVAFAVPGRPGGVVLGDQLLERLESVERRVVLAHERAHLDLHHHRFVRTAELCAAAFPILRPLARQVRFNCERWADEVAVTSIGSSPGAPAVALPFSGLGAAARVDALLHPGPRRGPAMSMSAASATILLTLTGSSVQLHHLASFAVHLCPS